MDRMDEFPVGVVYSKQGCNLVRYRCSRLLGFVDNVSMGNVDMGNVSMGRISMGRINGGRK
jgi:hypothetical protein